MRRAVSTLLVLWLSVLASCEQSRTQLVVTVTSDLPPSQLELVRASVVAADSSGAFPTQHEFPFGGGASATPLPFSFGIRPPGGNPDRQVQITVSAVGPGAPGPVIVTRVVHTGFIRGRTLLLRIPLTATCRDTTCSGEQTCDGTECIPIAIAPGTLPEVEPGAELGDAGTVTPHDASAADATADASVPCMEIPPGIHLGAVARPTAMTLVRNAPGQRVAVRVAYVVGDQLQLQGFSADLSTSVTGASSTIDSGVLEIEGATPSSGGAYEWIGAYRTATGLRLFDATSPGTMVHTAPVGAVGMASLPRGSVLEVGGQPVLSWQAAGSLSIVGLDLTHPQIAAGTTRPDVLAVSGAPGLTSTGVAIAVADVDASGHCRVRRVQTDGMPMGSATLATDGACSAPSVGELSDGRLLVAYHLPPSGTATQRVAFQILDAALAVDGAERILGDAADATLAVAIAPRGDGGALLVWQSPLALVYASVSAPGLIGSVRTVMAPGATSTDLGTFRAVRADDTRVAVAWIATAGIQLGVVCDPP